MSKKNGTPPVNTNALWRCPVCGDLTMWPTQGNYSEHVPDCNHGKVFPAENRPKGWEPMVQVWPLPDWKARVTLQTLEGYAVVESFYKEDVTFQDVAFVGHCIISEPPRVRRLLVIRPRRESDG